MIERIIGAIDWQVFNEICWIVGAAFLVATLLTLGTAPS